MAASAATDPGFEALLEHLTTTRGFDFTAYKRSTLMRRTRIRMQALQIESYTDYIDFLEVDPTEFGRLFDTMLINVTSFFRDPEVWRLVEREAIPAILASKEPREQVRVWSAGCSSGEEAYTLAMLFCDAIGNGASSRVKIYATDVDLDALNVARAAVYTARQLESLPNGYREKYFESAGGETFGLKRDLRRMVIFGRHDLLNDAPISRIDLLSCRNTLMYFNAESQARILSRFYFALRDSGFLVLGKAETLLTRSTQVAPVDLKLRLFRKSGDAAGRQRLLVSAQDGQRRPDVSPGRIGEAAFEVDPIAQVVVDAAGNIALANDSARRLFGLRDREINRPLQDHEMSYRPVDLRSMFDLAMSEQRVSHLAEVSWPEEDGKARWLDIQGVPLVHNSSLIGVKFLFRDITNFKLLQADLESSHSEIETAYEELNSSNEELETTNEELHSTVEELETTNEELQSTNEELETMNEELHSANEELEAVNQAMMERTGELALLNAQLNTILGSLGQAVIVLNRDLAVQIWNATAEDQWGVRADEVSGRPILGLDIGLPVHDLLAIVRPALLGDSPPPMSVQATNRRGRSMQFNATARPLNMGKDMPDGVILLIEEREPLSPDATR